MRRWLVYIACLFLFLEASSRIFWRMLDRTWGPIVPQQIGRFDPDLGWSLEPGASASSKSTGCKVVYRVNSLGFRGPEVKAEKPVGVFRIVVLGDSHAFGFGIPQGQTFSALLQGYFKNVEVVNLGVCGYGVDQYLLRLRRDGFPLDPDLVLCYVPHFADARHMVDKLWGVGKPRFVEKDGRLALTNQPVSNDSPLTLAALSLDSFLAEWVRTYAILRDTIYDLALRAKAKPGHAPPPDPEFVAETERMGWLIVQEMEQECRERHVPFVLSTRVGDLAVSAANHGVNTHFMAFALLNEDLALRHDPLRHPGVAANGIMAWELARFLMERKLVPESRWTLPPEAVAGNG